MASFMDYYQDELRKRGSAAPAAPKGVSLSSLSGEHKKADEEASSPINWVLDILSRPLSGVQRGLQASADVGDRVGKKARSGDTAGAVGDFLANGPLNPFGGETLDAVRAGAYSPDRADRATTSDTLEKYTDLIGKNNDPNYQDVPDNLAPGFKGGVGFAGDMLLDPINYIPGAVLASGAKKLVQGADAALSAVSKGLVGAKRTEKAAEGAAEATLKSAKAPKEKAGKIGSEDNPFEGVNNLDPGEFRPRQSSQGPIETTKTERLTFDAEAQPSLSAARTPKALETGADAAPVAPRTASFVDELLQAPKTKPEAPAEAPKVAQPEAGRYSDGPQVGVAPSLTDAPSAPASGAPNVADLIVTSPNRQPIADTLTGLADDVEAPRATQTYNEWANSLPPTYVIKDPSGAARPIPVAKLRDDIARYKDPAVKGALKPSREYIERTLNLLRQDYQRTAAPASIVTDALGAFRARAAKDKRSLQAALGDDLYDFLGKVNSPAKFQKTLADIRRVIEPDEGLTDALRNMDQNLARLLSERLGVPRSARAKTPEEAAAHAERLLNENEPYQAALAKGLAKALDAELTDLKSKGYIHYLRTMGLDVARTSSKRGEGLGRYVDQLNGFSQYTMLRRQGDAIEIAALDVMRARGVKGMSYTGLYSAQRTAIYKEAVLRVLDDQAQLLDDIGAHMSIGVGESTVQLSMNEVYRGLLSSADELGIARTIDQGLFNYGTQAAPTAVTDAVAAAVAGADRDTVLGILLDPKKYGNKGLVPGSNGKRPNNLIDSGHGWGFAQNAKAAAQRLADEVGAVVKPNPSGKGGWFVSYKVNGENRMADALADTIMNARGNLAARAAENEAAFVARTRAEVHKLSGDELAKIESFLKDPSGAIAKIRAFKARDKRIEAEAASINASPDAVRATEAVVDAALGQELVSTMMAAAKADTKYVSASTELDLRNANESFTDDVWDAVLEDYSARPAKADLEDPITGLRQNEEWADLVDETTPLHGDWRDMLFDEAEDFISKPSTGGKKPKKGRKGKFVDLSEDAPAMIDAFGQRIIDPYGIMKEKVGQWFNANHRASNAMPIAHAWQNSMSMRAAYVGHQLNAIHKAAKKISPDQELLPNVFAGIQRGVPFTDPKQAELADMIQGVLGDFFDLDASGSMGNVFLRTTSKPELINAMLKQKGIDQAFDLDAARKLSAETGRPLDQTIAEQWKGWKISDPLDFMHRLSQARQELAFNKGTAMSFIQMAKANGAVATKKTPGFVRIQASGESRFAAHLPDNIYVKAELASELQRVEQVFRTSREFQGVIGDFVRNTYAPLLNAWKFGITLPRPGHHIRNLIGDTSVTYMRRGTRYFGQSWKDAVKLLSTRAGYTDVNMLEAANRYGIADLPRGEDKLFSAGKFDFSADELYAALAEGGALPTYNIGEDFVDAGGRLNAILGKVTLRDTRVGEGLGKISEGRDHLARFQHFVQALRQDGKAWKGSREDLIQKAVKEVIKYHPDASLLTTMESKLRLAIPFYSWFGKILPALVESMVMHPGRLTSFSKASYNWAVANGLDPESLSDPFPDDQLFPSFISESALGPQFTANMLPIPGGDQQYIRLNPGIAHLDVFDSIGTDPVRGLAGMVSPLIRVPAELLSGGQWQSGAPIKDVSDYLDQSLPGVNYISNVTGNSVTGSVGSVLSGEGLDPQAQVEKGNKTDFDKYISIANWITGLGIQNLSRPNYINYAEIERRNEGGK